MGFGSKHAIRFIEKQNPITEEDKKLIDEKFETDNICSTNGTYCLRGCQQKEGKACQRLINKQKKYEKGL